MLMERFQPKSKIDLIEEITSKSSFYNEFDLKTLNSMEYSTLKFIYLLYVKPFKQNNKK